jgi:selenocysteine lyase/cysteine desulfurase
MTLALPQRTTAPTVAGAAVTVASAAVTVAGFATETPASPAGTPTPTSADTPTPAHTATPTINGSTPAVPAVVSAGLTVPLVTGGHIPYANLDHAASAPCLTDVQASVDELLPWYASVHRGAGFASQVSTRVYEQARHSVRRFVNAHSTDAVLFTRNTTDSLNLLAHALPRNTSVVVFDSEHHAALLPWRGNTIRLPAPQDPGVAVDAVRTALRDCPTGPRLVVVTGASNVTGELWPIAELAETAHRHGARIVVDAAQLAPHRPIDLRRIGADYLVFSGHKLYAPFGAGVLVGRSDWLRAAHPYLRGGGATQLVTQQRPDQLGVAWAELPDRHEAGSPNVVGVHALAVACATLGRHWTSVLAHERALLDRLRTGLATVPGLRELSVFGDDSDRVGVVSCTIDGHEPGLLAAALSSEYGIGVRDGAFCAHILTHRLTHGATAIRVSIGLGTTEEHVDRLVSALHDLVTTGPRWTYALDDGRWAPTPDPRRLPSFLEA